MRIHNNILCLDPFVIEAVLFRAEMQSDKSR